MKTAFSSEQLTELYKRLRREKKDEFNRSLSFGDYFTDRWERAEFEEFGEGTSIYDNVLIIGDVKIGKNTWVGPDCILDGSGGLEIGDYCSITGGVQIYTHHTVAWSLSLGKEKPVRKATSVGSGVYIGPNSVIQMGVNIGDKVVIGAMSFVNQNIPSHATAFGVPAKIVDENPVKEE